VHILHVYKDYPPVIGGIEHHVRALAEGQVELGHAVTVLVTNPGGSGTTIDTENGVRVIRARRLATLASTPISLALPRHLVRIRPDVTHLQAPYPIGEAAWLAVGRHPMVLSYQSDVVRQRVLGRLWAPALRRVLARADRIIASNPNMVACSPFLQAVRGKVTVVPIGVDAARFAQTDRAAALARYNPDGVPTVVFVGRLRYYKGLHVLIDALAHLRDARLVIAGSGALEADLRDRAASRGVADRIVWLGDVHDADLPHVLAAADVYVLPAVARSEAYGIAMVEAMATGLPAVSTELGTGTSWINLDGVTGRVAPPGDVAALAAAIGALLADGPLRERLGAAAQARILAEFTVETMIARILRVYREVRAG